jgi:two-component system, NtrC family, sensor kinase
MTNSGDAVRAAAPAQPLIVVKTAACPDGVEITIIDNGCGMSNDVLARAFEPLFTTKPAGRGTGLGLPLCRSVARQHDGDVVVQSTPEHGTRVLVRLALAPAALQAMVEA